MKTTISWIMAGFSIWGMVLNIQKKKSCFVLFGITNSFWIGYFFWIKEYAPCFLQFVFLLSSIWGLLKWHREGK